MPARPGGAGACRGCPRAWRDTAAALSNETINKLLVRLGQILDVAEERELIARNPMRVNSAGPARGW